MKPFANLIPNQTVKTERRRPSLSPEVDLFDIKNIQERMGRSPKPSFASPSPVFSDQLANHVAMFQKTHRVTITKDGVYIPQSLLGTDVEITHEEKRLPNGSLLIHILATPRNPAPNTFRKVALIDCSAELQWLAEHRDEYLGQWVALKGNQLLSYGEDAVEVYETARQQGVDNPVLIQIETPNELPFSGW